VQDNSAPNPDTPPPISDMLWLTYA